MVDRQWPVDVALAVLLVLPLSALAPQKPISDQKPAFSLARIGTADRLADSGRVGLIGRS